MVFPYGFIDIIFKKDVLETKGILGEIFNEYKPGAMQVDDKLILGRCAMSWLDAENQVKELTEKYELKYVDDFVLINGPHGLETKCNWIKEGRLKENDAICNNGYFCGTRYYEFVN